HRLRALLKAYGPFHLARVLPQALAAGAVETVYALVAARRGRGGDVGSAWIWNVRVLGDTRRARKVVQRSRRLPDSEVRRLQVHGSARLNAYLRGQLAGGDDRAQSLAAAGRGFAGSLRRGPLRAPLVVWSAMALVLLVGTRGLIRGGLPEVGQLARFPGHATTFLRHFTAGWRYSGLGSDAPAPAAFGLLGVADRKSTRLNSSHLGISYAVFCLKKKKKST